MKLKKIKNIISEKIKQELLGDGGERQQTPIMEGGERAMGVPEEHM